MKLLRVTVLGVFGFLAVLVAGAGVVEAASGEGGHGLDFLIRVINFAILLGALVYLLKKPLGSYLDAKTEQIRNDLKEAAAKRERAEADRKEAKARLEGLDDEIAEARKKGLAAAEDERQRILEAAKAEAARLADHAKRELADELELARRKLTARAAELSVELARKKIGDEISDDDRRALFEQGLEKLGEAR